MFECNSDHKSTLEEISKTNKNYNFIVRDEAIWKENSEMQFYISNDRWGDLGCTLDPSKRESLDLANPRTVKTINFSDFLLSFDEDDYIVVKLDIEGAEYELLNHMLSTNCLEYVNDLFVEFHLGKIKNINEEQHNKLISKLYSLGFKYADIAWEKENITLKMLKLYENA